MAGNTEFEKFAVQQSEFVSHVAPETIPHGAIVPIPTIKKYMHGGIIVELGAGRGASADTITAAGLTWMGVEINKDAVSETREKGYVSFPGDARNFWESSLNLAALSQIETANGVLLQGLLANIIENRDIRRVLRTADIFLRPGGYLFVAEPVRYDQAYWLNKDDVYEGLSLEKWRQRWLTRYRLNEAAGLPRGVFAVAKLGPDKDALDWAQSLDAVQTLINSKHLERFARHVNEDAVIAYARRQHFALADDPQHTLMFSRNREPLPGVVFVFQKVYGLYTKRNQLLYEYSPWYKDMTPEERHAYQNIRGWRSHADPDYFGDYWKRMKKNFPKSMQPPKEYTI